MPDSSTLVRKILKAEDLNDDRAIELRSQLAIATEAEQATGHSATRKKLEKTHEQHCGPLIQAAVKLEMEILEPTSVERYQNQVVRESEASYLSLKKDVETLEGKFRAYHEKSEETVGLEEDRPVLSQFAWFTSRLAFLATVALFAFQVVACFWVGWTWLYIATALSMSIVAAIVGTVRDFVGHAETSSTARRREYERLSPRVRDSALLEWARTPASKKYLSAVPPRVLAKVTQISELVPGTKFFILHTSPKAYVEFSEIWLGEDSELRLFDTSRVKANLRRAREVQASIEYVPDPFLVAQSPSGHEELILDVWDESYEVEFLNVDTHGIYDRLRSGK